MGNFPAKEFVEVLEDEFPVTPTITRRVLDRNFDPRSPTCEITRTPIQVERTPDPVDPRSPTVGIVRTPIVMDKLEEIDDPRSPTVGIDRTPIYTNLLKRGERENSPLAAPLILSADDLTEHQEEEEEDEEPQAVQEADVEKEDISSPPVTSLAACLEMAETDKTQDIKEDTTGKADKKESKEIQNEKTDTTKEIPITPRESNSIRKRKPKQLFQTDSSSPRSPLRVIDNNPRSPLAGKEQSPRSPLKVKDNGPRSPLKSLDNSPRTQTNQIRKIDLNSPRAIVQRKQATKLNSKLGCSISALQGQTRSPGRSRSPAKNFQIYHDNKENM